jgi:hypothetical protein
MVQDPASAKYDGMPQSAIHTGLADFVLPPEEMPEHLIGYVDRMLKGEGISSWGTGVYYQRIRTQKTPAGHPQCFKGRLFHGHRHFQ